MSDDSEFRMPAPDPALKRLDFLVGTWELTGRLEAGPAGPAGEISGRETFEWLDGGFFLVHRWEGVMTFGGNTMTDSGYEFFDYVQATGTYRTRFVNNLGAPTTSRAAPTPVTSTATRWSSPGLPASRASPTARTPSPTRATCPTARAPGAPGCTRS